MKAELVDYNEQVDRETHLKPHANQEPVAMQTHHTKAVVDKDGCLKIEKLPFPAGEAVEVVIIPAFSAMSKGERYPLRGTPIQFADPTEPVAETDWEALP